MRVLMYCGVNEGRLVTKSDIAEACNTSENHLAQVINRLAQLGFIYTQRGRNGGLRLSRPMQEIFVGQVFRATEASVPITECFNDQDNTCPLISACRLKDVIAKATEAFYASMDDVSLADLVCHNSQLEAILSLPISCPKEEAIA
mgnify:FL=1